MGKIKKLFSWLFGNNPKQIESIPEVKSCCKSRVDDPKFKQRFAEDVSKDILDSIRKSEMVNTIKKQ